jgi:cytochrome c peroxidase
MLKKLLFTLLGLALIAAIAVGTLAWLESQKFPKPEWSKSERSTISALWIGNLPPLSDDPSNRVANNIDAAKFGHQLFFDKRFSGNGKVACMTCHDPEKHFTDGNALAVGVGITQRSSPSIVGTAYHPFIFWDGRADSQWAQAMGPMESAVEHGGTLSPATICAY